MRFTSSAITAALMIASANAFSVNYLDNLPGSSAPQKARPETPSLVSALETGYLGQLSGGSGAQAAPSTPVAPSAPVASAGDYLSNLGGGSSAPSGGGMSSYLDSMGGGSTAPSGGGMPSYLDSVGSAPPAQSTTYSAPPTPPAPPAPVTPPAPVAKAAPAAGDYLSNLGGGSAAPSGAGMTSYLDSMGGGSPAASRIGGGAPVYLAGEPAKAEEPKKFVPFTPLPETKAAGGDYLSALGGGSSAPSGAGVPGYLDALKTTAASAPTGAGITSYLDTMGAGTPPSGSSTGTSYTPPSATDAAKPAFVPAPAATVPATATPAPVAGGVVHQHTHNHHHHHEHHHHHTHTHQH